MYSNPDLPAELRQVKNAQITIHNFCGNFPDWLEAADLSISMAGYNTCMNLLAAGVPALLYPFSQNREQRMRVAAFTDSAAFTLLETEDLAPARLAEVITKNLHCERHRTQVKLDGATTSCQLIEDSAIWEDNNDILSV